jgi:hypothetical protein
MTLTVEQTHEGRSVQEGTLLVTRKLHQHPANHCGYLSALNEHYALP